MKHIIIKLQIITGQTAFHQ